MWIRDWMSMMASATCSGRIVKYHLIHLTKDTLAHPSFVRPTMQRSKDFVVDTREGVRWLLETGRRKND